MVSKNKQCKFFLILIVGVILPWTSLAEAKTLQQAILDNDPEAVKQAITNGADISLPFEDGSYPATLAAANTDVEMIHPLIKMARGYLNH